MVKVRQISIFITDLMGFEIIRQFSERNVGAVRNAVLQDFRQNKRSFLTLGFWRCHVLDHEYNKVRSQEFP